MKSRPDRLPLARRHRERGCGCGQGSRKRGRRTFLLKMPVIGENFGWSLVPDGLHRNTIHQAVPLCRAAPDRVLSRREKTPGSAVKAKARWWAPTARNFRCPIPGCDKTYEHTRGGWDAHVGSLRAHPLWHPELASAEERKLRFKEEFAEFF